jgi:hypothetical protein
VTPIRIAPSLIILAVLIGLLLFFPGSSPALAEGPRLVLAFYYAWYDMNTWSSGLLADQPREPYVSSDPASRTPGTSGGYRRARPIMVWTSRGQ